MAESFSVATLNLLNLQRPGEPTYPNVEPLSQADYEVKIDWLARLIRELDADVVGLQELWREECLDDLLAHPALATGGYEAVAKTRPGAVSVAALTRIPVTEGPTWIEAFPSEVVLRKAAGDHEMDVRISQFSRPVLHLRVSAHPSEPPVHIWNAHLKSKRPMWIDADDRPRVDGHGEALGQALSLIRRGAEAAALRILVRKALRGNDAPGIVLGDLNDGQRSVVLSILTGTPGVRLNVNSRVGGRTDAGLYPVSALQQYRSLRDVYYTYIYEHRRESLDHILVSEQFYDHSRQRRWAFQEMRVYNDYLVEFDEDASRLRADHAGVVARFEHDPA